MENLQLLAALAGVSPQAPYTDSCQSSAFAGLYLRLDHTTRQDISTPIKESQSLQLDAGKKVPKVVLWVVDN